MTTAEKRETLGDQRDAVAEINDELASKKDELPRAAFLRDRGVEGGRAKVFGASRRSGS